MASPQRPFGQDEIALHQAAGFGIDDAGHLHPIDQRNHHGDDPQARAQERCQHDGKKQGRKGHHQIGKAHQRIADEAAHIAGQNADPKARSQPRCHWRQGR